MCTIEGNTGTIAATGTTTHTAAPVPSDFAGTIAGIRHYSTGTTELSRGGPLLYSNEFLISTDAKSVGPPYQPRVAGSPCPVSCLTTEI